MNIQAIKEKISSLPIEALARQSHFVKRKPKKIIPLNYLSSFVSCVFKGNISQANWAREFTLHCGQSISEQALQCKVQIRHESFARDLLEAAIEQVILDKGPSLEGMPLLAAFERVVVYDSTCVKLPAGVMAGFPGSCSQHGANAMARIQLRIDLLRGAYRRVSFSSFRQNDLSHAVELAQEVQAGELCLFDLGYFKLAALEQLIQTQASFLCRYSSKVSIYQYPDEEALDLASYLKRLEKQGRTCWDTHILLGRQEKIPLRLVAIKVPPQVAQARRRKKRNNRDKRKKYTRDYLYLLGWNIFVTNVAGQVLPATELTKVYSLRWRIEIIFKAWKSKLDLASLFDKQSYGLGSRAVIQLHLVLFTITLFLTSWYQELSTLLFQKTGRKLSLLKFCGLIKYNLEVFLKLYHQQLDDLIQLLAYHYSYDKRRDRRNFLEILYDKKLS